MNTSPQGTTSPFKLLGLVFPYVCIGAVPYYFCSIKLFFIFLCVFRLHEILEVAEDMAIDIPHMWLYLAELITPMLHEGGIPMGELFRWVQGFFLPPSNLNL